MLDESLAVAAWVTAHPYLAAAICVACLLSIAAVAICWACATLSGQIAQREDLDQCVRLRLTHERRRMIVDEETRRKDW